MSDIKADVLIVGGGLNGMPMAIALASAGLKTVVIDRDDPEKQIDAKFDGRVSAIAHCSVNLFKSIGLWDHIEDKQPMLDIRITDGPSKLFLHYDHKQLGDEPFGYMVENRVTRKAIRSRASELDNLILLAPDTLSSLERDQHKVTATTNAGENITARMVIGADGRNSHIQKQAGLKSVGWDYDQSGIVCTVAHQHPHNGVAQERFLSPGPFAILPMTGNRSSLVWTEKRAVAANMMALEDADFLNEMKTRFGDYLGELEIVGPRWSYPLSLHQSESYISERLALIGDAAHGMHPIAGQGLNLGLRDVAALAECIVDAARLGLDIGNATTLESYQRWRRFDGIALLAVTDGLNRLFVNDLPPVTLARDLGLGAVNKMPNLKGLFMEHARGSMGILPRLLQGQPL